MGICPAETTAATAIAAAVSAAAVTDASACEAAPSPPVPYVTPAVNFDGINDLGLRGSDLTGNADNAKGILAFWTKFNGGDGSNQSILTSQTAKVRIQRGTDNKFEIRLLNVGSTAGLIVKSSTTITVASGWTLFLASWDQAVTPLNHLYFGDVDSKGTPTVNTTAVIDYTEINYSVGANISSATKLDGCLADLYFNTSEYLDFSVEANRRLFIDASGKPVDLGADGSTPTGSAPIVFLKGDETDFYNNLGPGGAFVETGALTICADSPSD